jgi:hypothetical protein
MCTKSTNYQPCLNLTTYIGVESELAIIGVAKLKTTHALVLGGTCINMCMSFDKPLFLEVYRLFLN